MPETRRRRRWPRLLLAAALSALLALACAELYLRRTMADYFGPAAFYAGLYRLDAEGHPDVVPGHCFEMRFHGRTTTAHVSSLGLRSGEIAARQPGEKRLLCIGDSMVFGIGVEDGETFTALLGEQLGRALRQPVVARSAGAPGFSTLDQPRVLRRVQMAFAPDLIVAGVFVANDLEDNFTTPRTVVDGHLLVGPFAAMAAASTRGRLALRWRTAFVVEHFLRQHWPALALDIPPPDAAALADFPPDRHMGLFLDAVEETPALQRILDRWEAGMRELRAVAGGTPIVAVLLPDSLRASAGAYRGALLAHGLEPAKHALGTAQRRLAERAARLSIPVVDLTPAFLAQMEPAALFLDEMHFSVAGHRLAAEQLVEVLAEQLR